MSKFESSLIGSDSTWKYLLFAIGEIALVVIGIRKALQANNRNEWKKDQRAEMEILNELRLNLENNVSLINERAEYF